MASIKSPLGIIRGGIGNLVFRENGNTNTISAVPSSFNTPNDEAAVNRRTKFAFVVKFSAAIIKLFSLSIFWKRVTPVGNRRLNKVFKTNYAIVTPNLDLTDLRLSDDPSIVVENDEINIQANGIQLSADALGADSEVVPAIEKTICAEGVLALSSPLDSAAPKFSFIPVHSNDVNIVLNDPISFNLPIHGANLLLVQRYAVKKAALVLVTKNSAGQPVQSSETLYS